MRILIVEDDAPLAQGLAFHLKHAGFAADVCEDGLGGLEAASQGQYELILLDRMLPGIDGMEILTRLRREGISVPVIFLTALGQVQDRTEGLNQGADDYIVKPFVFEELLARIRCVLRRPGTIQLTERLQLGDVVYEPQALTARCGDRSITLSKKLGELLELFLRNPGQTLMRETILLRVWGMDYDVEDGNLDNYIYFLRRSLGKIGSRLHLATIRGVGYRMEDRP